MSDIFATAYPSFVKIDLAAVRMAVLFAKSRVRTMERFWKTVS
jgi:hypothetical protein